MLHVEASGEGATVVLVHGSLTTPGRTWDGQLPLADRWRLVLATRRGYEPNLAESTSDWETDGRDLAELLDGGAHVVGHSYGALGAMAAAASRPQDVRSLTLVEAPVMGLVRGHPVVEERIAAHEDLLRTVGTPREFHVGFLRRLGAPVDAVPDPLPPSLERQVLLLTHERPPWEGALPVGPLAAAPFRTLVVTGGWDPALEAANDALVAALGSRGRRCVLIGRGHVVQRLGGPFNDVLERHLRHGDAAGP